MPLLKIQTCFSFCNAAHQRSRPPTGASWTRRASGNSVQSLLRLLRGKCPRCLGGWLCFERARLLGEGVDALLCWSDGLLLQLQIQHACKFAVSVLLDHAKERFDDTLHLLVLQAVCLRHRCDDLSLREDFMATAMVFGAVGGVAFLHFMAFSHDFWCGWWCRLPSLQLFFLFTDLVVQSTRKESLPSWGFHNGHTLWWAKSSRTRRRDELPVGPILQKLRVKKKILILNVRSVK